MPSRFVFGLPPSAGDALQKSDELKSVLGELGFKTFQSARTYGDLIRDLLVGRVHAAWATPAICAQVGNSGGRTVLRAIKDGRATYRSVLFALASRKLDLTLLKGLRAVWSDAQSLSGYMLPRTLLFARDMNPITLFSKETFLGSFEACVDAVLERRGDVSATEAPAEGSTGRVDTFVQIAGPRAGELAPLVYTPECPFGGIVLSPKLPTGSRRVVESGFLQLVKDTALLKVASSALGVDGFEVPPAGAYERLWQFLRSSPQEKLGIIL
ncbi:MAG: PhnD/SsuA/transferrin family substrate-binding protein [Myxococcota bacterium]